MPSMSGISRDPPNESMTTLEYRAYFVVNNPIYWPRSFMRSLSSDY